MFSPLLGGAITNITGGDLNDIVKLGAYMCQTGVISRSLTNCPVTSAFYMYVVRGHSPSIVYQIIIAVQSSFCNVCIRMKGLSSAVSDTPWFGFAGTEID